MRQNFIRHSKFLNALMKKAFCKCRLTAIFLQMLLQFFISNTRILLARIIAQTLTLTPLFILVKDISNIFLPFHEDMLTTVFVHICLLRKVTQINHLLLKIK